MSTDQSLMGLMPAAGRAARMGKLPCSKELLPVAVRESNGDAAVVVLADLLLDLFADCQPAAVVTAIAPHKQDIAEYFSTRSRGIQMRYVSLESPSTPHSIDACFEHCRDKTVMFGFPDIVLPPGAGFAALLQQLRHDRVDAVLGLFPTQQPERVDMVKTAADGRVQDIRIKQPSYPADYQYTWSMAVWGPAFSGYLHENLAALHKAQEKRQAELYVGDVFNAALADGLKIGAQVLSTSPCIDAGTPASYAQVLAAAAASTTAPGI